MHTKPEDVDLELRVRVPGDAKGGFCPGVYLTTSNSPRGPRF